MISVPRDRLSDADRAYLDSLATPADNPFAAAMPSAAKEGDSSRSPGAAVPGTMRSLPESPSAAEALALPDTGKMIDLAGEVSEEPFTPDAAGEPTSPPNGSVAIGSTDAYDRVAPPVALDPASSKLLVSIGRHQAGRSNEARGRIYLADLQKKTSSLVWEQPSSVEVVGHDAASGRTLIIDGLDHFQRGGKLVMVQGMEEGKPKPLYRRLLPGLGKPGFAPKIEWAQLLSSSHVAAIVDGALLVWDLPAAQLMYKIDKVSPREPPVFIANQLYMAVPQSGSVVIVHTATGTIRGKIPTGTTLSPGVAFDPSGRLLAICFSNQYLVWDCVENRVAHQATTTAHLGASPVNWIGPKMFLAATGDAVDLELGMSVWKYTTQAGTPKVVRGDKLQVVTTSPSCVLVSVEVPHDAVQKAVTTLMRAGDAAMLVRPGSDVAIAVEALAGTDQAEIKASLAEAAEKAGWKVSDKAPITLVAKIGRGKPEELHFRKIGRPLTESSTATLTPFTAVLEIRRGADVLWSRSTSNRIPPMLRLEEGETVQDAVKRFEKPDAQFFARLDLPPRIPKPEIAASVGRSMLREGEWYDMTDASTPQPKSRRRR